MSYLNKVKDHFKKALAVSLGAAMVFGSLMLPNNAVSDNYISASADGVSVGDFQYFYDIKSDRGVETLHLKGVFAPGDTVEIPSVLTIRGVDYPVTHIDSNFLKGDRHIKNIVFPESVKYIGDFVLYNSIAVNITLPDGLEHLGRYFAANCSSLESVTYSGTSITEENMGDKIFADSNIDGLKSCGLMDEDGVLCLGNWLLNFPQDLDRPNVKVADLGTLGIKIENIGPSATYNTRKIENLDLEGVKYIAGGNFVYSVKLKSVINDDSVENVAQNAFQNTPWLDKCKEDNLIKIGKTIQYYKTDSNILDLTSGALAGTKHVSGGALTECKDLDTIFCDTDCYFDGSCFYQVQEPQHEPSNYIMSDNLPLIPRYNIKTVYWGNKKMSYSLILEDEKAYAWMKKNRDAFDRSALIKDMVENKVKAIFKQMDIPFYGLGNERFGLYTPTEEFYIRLKIHEYMSMYKYDDDNNYGGLVGAFLFGGKVQCDGYAQLTHLLLECAGIEAKTLFCDPEGMGCHFWNSTRIGDEWFESDDGWDAQRSHNYDMFLLSSAKMKEKNPSFHNYMYAYDSYHIYPYEKGVVERVEGNRVLGDVDGNTFRNDIDSNKLWAYLKGEAVTIDEKAADLNFDGSIDVTDAVLLENFANGVAIDVDNIPIDGLAPTVKVAFMNDKNYDDIKYLYTDREGYIVLPDDLFEAPEGKKLSYDIGKAGEKVRITVPYTVVQTKWINADEPESSSVDESSVIDNSSAIKNSSSSSDSKTESSSSVSDSRPDKVYKLGDVNNDKAVDIEDAVAIIQHINGMTPLTDEEMLRADVSKDNNIDIDDAVMIISYINGNSTF